MKTHLFVLKKQHAYFQIPSNMLSSCLMKLITKASETTLQYLGNLFKYHLGCYHYTARASKSWHLSLRSGLKYQEQARSTKFRNYQTVFELLVFSHLVHFRWLLGSTNSSSKHTPSILRSLPLQYFASHLPLSASKIIGFSLSPVFKYHLFSLLLTHSIPPLQQECLQNNHDQRRLWAAA